MKGSAFVLVSLFCQGHAFLGSPDSRNRPQAASLGGGFSGGPPPPGAPDLRCPPEGLDHYAGPECYSFFECVDGVSSLEECPSGLLYDPYTPPGSYPCEHAAKVNCTVPLPKIPPVCPDETMRHLPDPDSCGAFYECRGGVAVPRECPEDLLYNAFSPAARYPCDYPLNVVCGASPPPLEPSPGVSFSPQRPQDRKPDEPKKVFNFYSYVTNNW